MPRFAGGQQLLDESISIEPPHTPARSPSGTRGDFGSGGSRSCTPRSPSSQRPALSSAFQGSVTELQELSAQKSRRPKWHSSSSTGGRARTSSLDHIASTVVLGSVDARGRVGRCRGTTFGLDPSAGKSMSAAPVESLARPSLPSRDENLSIHRKRIDCLCSVLFPQSSLRSTGKLPIDYILFMISLGCIAAVLGFMMDLGIERLHKWKAFLLEVCDDLELMQRESRDGGDDGGAAGDGGGDNGGGDDGGSGSVAGLVSTHAGWMLMRALVWVAWSLGLSWLSIETTAKLSPQAAGSAAWSTGRLGEATAGHHALLRLHLKA